MVETQNPSPEWTPEERLRVIERISLNALVLFNEGRLPSQLARSLFATAYNVAACSAEFLEHNRSQILSDMDCH